MFHSRVFGTGLQLISTGQKNKRSLQSPRYVLPRWQNEAHTRKAYKGMAERIAPEKGEKEQQIICAAFGKLGDKLKKCTACTRKSVRYDVSCQRAHRKAHRKECKQRERELSSNLKVADVAAGLEATRIAEAADINNNDDDGLFGPFPPRPECPICFLPLPLKNSGSTYMSCCGNTVCNGCDLENTRLLSETNMKRSHKKQPPLEESCPFCRAPTSQSDEEALDRLHKRIERNDPEAFLVLGGYYRRGENVAKDERRAFQLFVRAAKLGSTEGLVKVSGCYKNGSGVEEDGVIGDKYLRMAASEGHPLAHTILGLVEKESGNIELAMKHCRVGAAFGHTKALDFIKDGYIDGRVNKDDFVESLRAYQAARDEERSEERDRAVVYREKLNSL